MHRTWKWTQIEKIKKYLGEIWKKVYIIRWDWSRKWTNDSNYYDPESEFFKEFTENKFNKSIEDWEIASDRMQREIKIWQKRLLKKINNWDEKDVIVLVDRWPISKAILNWDLSKENLLEYTTWNWKKEKRILPDMILSLEADTDTLLSRFNNLDNDEQSKLRRKNIINKNIQYTEIIDKLPEEIKSKIVRIDTSKDIIIIFEEIQKDVKKYFNF